MAYIPSLEEVMQATGESIEQKVEIDDEKSQNSSVLSENIEFQANSDFLHRTTSNFSSFGDFRYSGDLCQPNTPDIYMSSPLNLLLPVNSIQPYFFTYSNYSLHTLTEADILNFNEEFEQYGAIYSSFFCRREQRQHAQTYLKGLLSDIDDKSAEGIVIELIGPNERAVRNMQHFISQGAWDNDAILKQHWVEVEKYLGDEDAVFTLDGSDFPKQGDESVAVQRQYCGQLGKRANCQAGVFVGYVSPDGYTLLDRRLYVPEKWFTDEYAQKREKCGVPTEVTFKTKPELGLEILSTIVAQKSLSARWLTCDEAFGRSTPFLDEVAQLGLWYFAEVPHNTRVWQELPKVELPPYKGRGRKPTKEQVVEGEASPITVLELANSISSADWSRHIIKEGSKGPIVADFAFRRVFGVRDDLPGAEVWLVLRRSEGEIKTYLSNAPANIQRQRLVKVSALRWPIEICFEESKQELGMGDYQVRGWRGWHHHMTLVILAHFFLVRLRVLFADKAPVLTIPQIIQLLSSVLPKVPNSPAKALAIVTYRQQRNHAAYLSHRKRRLQKLKIAA